MKAAIRELPELSRRVDSLEQNIAAVDAAMSDVDKRLDAMAKIVRELGTPMVGPFGAVRRLVSPDGSIDIRASADGNAVEMEIV